MAEISVIVPIYNTERYLRMCLDSLAVQTMDQVEVLLVDDGSSDSSRVICEEYCRRFSWFSYYYKKNGGLSDARNYGIDRACGRYLAFVDSDDFVEPDFLEQMWKSAQKEKVQMVCCGYYEEEAGKNHKIVSSLSGRISPEQFWKSIFDGEEIGNFMCNKLFDRRLFSRVRFPIGKKYEDMQTLYRLEEVCEGISAVQLPLYHYISRRQSITGSFDQKSAADLSEAAERIQNYVRKRYPSLEHACDCYMLKQHIILVNALSKSGIFYGNPQWNRSRNHILQDWKLVGKLERKFLLCARLLRAFPRLYGRLQYARKKAAI